MAVWVDPGCSQMDGLPALKESTYVELGKTFKIIYAEAMQQISPDPSDYYTI